MKALPSPRDYSQDTLELALNVLAYSAGRPTRASEILASQGIHIPFQTLGDWKNRWADRYNEICTNLQGERAERMATGAEDVVLAAQELEAELLEDIRTQRPNLKPNELAGALRNITTTKALNMEKVVNPLRNRPSIIIEDRNADEILRSLESRTPKTVDTTAEELDPQDTTNPVSLGERQS